MHDSRVLHYVTSNDMHRFPHPKPGKYYLVDNGYNNKKEFLAPFKGYQYHQPSNRNRQLWDDYERFNRAHSSLHSCIEKTFGV